MSVSAAAAVMPSEWPDSLVPRLATENAATAPKRASGKDIPMFGDGDDSPSFWDMVDVINPLQHIPLINDLYREATGDKIGMAARLAGGTLFGGPLGLLGATFNAMLEEETGKDLGGHILALFRDDEPAQSGSALAQATDKPSGAGPEAVAAPAESPALARASATAKPLLLPDMPGEVQDTVTASPQMAAAVKAPEPPPPAAVPAAPVQLADARDTAGPPPVEKTEGRPLALLGRQPRLMPVPARNTPMATQSPPAVAMTQSTSGTRSYAPVTGQRPQSAPITPAMAQEMAASQSATATANQASGDWFSSAMMQGLSKYERNSRSVRGGGGTITEAQ